MNNSNTRSVRTQGKAAEKYASLTGKHVIIYYRDMRDTDRKLHGVIVRAEGDVLHLQNEEWQGVLDCRHARILLVSTVDGWNSRDMEETNEERGWLTKLFGRR
jgi:hypothetical protein